MDWNDLKHFLALSRTGSVRAAGASLGVSHSTVLRRVQSLETELGARLFDRSRDGFVLTLAGHEMVATAEVMEAQVAELARSLSGRDERFAGPVVLTCCDVYISDLLIRELTPFLAQYPEIELGISNDSRSYDLSKREADVAVRILGRGSSPPEHLIGRRLAPVTVCSYIARAHPHRDPKVEGAQPRWVAFDDRSILTMILKDSCYSELPQWGSVSSLPLAVQATRAGLGICKLPTYVGEVEGSLQRLEPPELMHVADLWLLSHADLRDNARLRETRRRIVAAFEGHMAVFDGTHQSGA